MRRCVKLLILVVVGLIPLTESRGGPFTHAERKVARPPSAYSPWHYWAPTAVRWVQNHQPATVPNYSTDKYSGVPNPTGMAVYPNPAVSPDAYYRGTGLSYDPLGPFAVHPPATNPR